MAGAKVIQFFLLISFVIFSTHAVLNVLLTDGKGENGFVYETDINTPVDERGIKYYNGCVNNETYTPGEATIKVIVYIKSLKAMKDTALRQKCLKQRQSIAATLSSHKYELLYLGVKGFVNADKHFIAEFLLQSINIIFFQINTLGEKKLNLEYSTAVHNLSQYQEEEDVFGGNLTGRLRLMDEGYYY